MTIELVGWALVNSLWQGSAIAVVFGATRVFTRRAGASARYAVALVALGATVIIPVSTTIARRESIASGTSVVTVSSPSRASMAGRESGQAMSATPRDARPHFVGPTAPSGRIEGAFGWIVGAWLLGVLALSVRLVGGIVRARRLARNGVALVEDDVAAIARGIAERLGIRRAVRVLRSTHVDVPMVVGWVAPLVLVPASVLTGLTPSQLEMLLAHELAHIRRYDVFVNLAQRVVETLLFFHPAVWWISSRVRAEREHCCDDVAITLTGADRRVYGATLLALEESRTSLLAVSATGGPLLSRIRRIVAGEPEHAGLASRWVPALVSIAAVLFVAGSIDARSLGRTATIAIGASPVPATPAVVLETKPAASSAPRPTPPSIKLDSLHRKPHMLSRPVVIGAASLALASGSVVAQSKPNFDGQWTFASCGGCAGDSLSTSADGNRRGFGPGWGADVTIRHNDTELTIFDETPGDRLRTVYRLTEPSAPVFTTGANGFTGFSVGMSDLTLTQSRAQWKGDTLVVPLTGVQDSTISIAFSMSLFLDAAGELNTRWRVGRVRVSSGSHHFDFDPAVPSGFKGSDTLTIRYRKR